MSVFSDTLRNEVGQIPDTSVFCLAACFWKTGYLGQVKRKRKNMRPVEAVLVHVTVAVILLLLIQLNRSSLLSFEWCTRDALACGVFAIHNCFPTLHRVVKGKILLVFRAITVITLHLQQIINISTLIHGEHELKTPMLVHVDCVSCFTGKRWQLPLWFLLFSLTFRKSACPTQARRCVWYFGQFAKFLPTGKFRVALCKVARWQISTAK